MKRVLVIMLAVVMLLTMFAGCKKKEADTIKVGILGPHTGEYAQYGLAVLNGAKLYIDKINEEGGINGKKIEPLIYDQKGDSTEAITAFSRMVDEGISGLIGDVLTGNTIAVVGEAYPINMPMITASATAEAVTFNAESNTVYTNVFRTCFIDPFQGIKMAEYAKEVLGAAKTAVIFETGNDYAVGLKDAFVKRAQEIGLEVVATEGYAKGDKDFKSQLTNISGKSPDVVFSPNYYEDDALIVTQARDIGLQAVFMGGDGWASVAKYASAEDLEGSVYCAAYASGASDAMIDFEQDYIDTYGEDTLNMFAALGYDAAIVLVEALKEAEKTEYKSGSDEYKNAVVNAIKNTKAVGVTGSYKFDERNNPIKEAVIIKIEDGKEVFSQMY